MEVGPQVLDNGRVRLEFTEHGGIRRACIDGAFLPLAGPGMVPMRNGRPFGTFEAPHVVEDGPVRARLSFTWKDSSGTARVTYSLYAHENNWQVHTSWLDTSAKKPPKWSFPTMWRQGLWRWGSMSGHQETIMCRDGEKISTHYAHWAALCDQDQQEGIAVAAGGQALRATVERGVLSLYGNGPWTLTAWPQPQPMAQLALQQVLQGRINDGGRNQAPLYRLLDAGSLVPQWARPVGQHIELLLVEHHGRQGRAQLIPEFIAETGSEAWLCDIHGNHLRELKVTNDQHGWNIPYQAGDVLLVRWQYC